MLSFLHNSEQLEASGEKLAEIFLECFYFKTHQTLTHLNVIMARYENTLKSLLNVNKVFFKTRALTSTSCSTRSRVSGTASGTSVSTSTSSLTPE